MFIMNKTNKYNYVPNQVNIRILIWIRDIRFASYPMTFESESVSELKCGKKCYPDPIPYVSYPIISLIFTTDTYQKRPSRLQGLDRSARQSTRERTDVAHPSSRRLVADFAPALFCCRRRPPARLLVRGVFRLVSRDRLLLACPCTSDSSPLPPQHFAISNNQQQIGE